MRNQRLSVCANAPDQDLLGLRARVFVFKAGLKFNFLHLKKSVDRVVLEKDFPGLMIKTILLATIIAAASISSSQAHCGSCEHKDAKKDKTEKKEGATDDKTDKDSKGETKPEEKK